MSTGTSAVDSPGAGEKVDFKPLRETKPKSQRMIRQNRPSTALNNSLRTALIGVSCTRKEKKNSKTKERIKKGNRSSANNTPKTNRGTA